MNKNIEYLNNKIRYIHRTYNQKEKIYIFKKYTWEFWKIGPALRHKGNLNKTDHKF